MNGLIPIADNGFWQVRSAPAPSLILAADLFNKKGGQTIVEIGTGMHGDLSGNSMLVWAERTSAKRIVAVDTDQTRLDEVKAAIPDHPHVELTLSDGIQYLEMSTCGIDMLYLDFWNPAAAGTTAGDSQAEAYSKAFIAAQENLSPQSIILIDDTDHIHPWKQTQIVPLAQEAGFQVRWTGRQTLLER